MIRAILRLIRFNAILVVSLIGPMVLWSFYLTAFDDFGNGMKMLLKKQGGIPSSLDIKSTMTCFPSSPIHTYGIITSHFIHHGVRQ